MSDKVQVHPRGYGEPKAALSQGILSGGFLFVSGAVAFHPETGEIVGDDVATQTRQVMENIRAVLKEVDLDLDDVVQSRAYLTRIQDDFPAFDSVYREFFSEPLPARSTIGVELAIPGLLVEVDVMAKLKS
ncbi:RidA family protein [Pseudactinotalea sp. Z1739]|uniref:RidA family protein n=1 Tax=Pseudactinotalea sp. Z1739 TaxID=3413028 RepID=UPI003C7A3232